jgi:predicted O-methyltransferase YrrM
MLEQVKALLKQSPGLYRTADSLAVRIRALLGLPRYFYCRLTNQVYLGPVMLGRQTWGTRVPHMRQIINDQLARSTGPFNVLEIGSWAGQSAMLWAGELRRSGRAGNVFCVDAWRPFASKEQIGLNTGVAFMDSAARRDRIFPLFWHNIKASGLSDTVVPLRGRSMEVLPVLQRNHFDLVFVDASHAYTDLMNDLRCSAPLVKQGGVICGDDLEFQADEVNRALAERERERDFILDTETGQEYHPGVTMGIDEFFGRRISCRDGFWAMRRTGDGWEDVPL